MALTQDQLLIVQGLTNIILKIVVAVCLLVGFFIILHYVITAKIWQDRAVLGALDGILGFTIYPMTKHFFPAVKEAEVTERRLETTSQARLD